MSSDGLGVREWMANKQKAVEANAQGGKKPLTTAELLEEDRAAARSKKKKNALPTSTPTRRKKEEDGDWTQSLGMPLTKKDRGPVRQETFKTVTGKNV